MKNQSPAADMLLNQSVLFTKLQRRLDNQLSIHGISFKEYQILKSLYDAPEHLLRRIELAELIGVTASGVTRLLAPMEKNRLIEKRANPRDARVSLVMLSSAGQTLFENAKTVFEHSAEQLTSDLTERQLETLSQLLSRIAN